MLNLDVNAILAVEAVNQVSLSLSWFPICKKQGRVVKIIPVKNIKFLGYDPFVCYIFPQMYYSKNNTTTDLLPF